jgi:eukaryotic-like serine/threonine-protein kinase
MAIVKITPTGDSIKCKAGQNGRFQFNVSNPARKEIRFSAEVKGIDKAIDWLTVDGSAERSLGSSATSTVEVLARPPANLLKMEEGNKRFNFKLRVHDAGNPKETVDSMTVSVEVIPVPPPPKKFPWWIVILLAVIGLGVVIWLNLPTGSVKQ